MGCLRPVVSVYGLLPTQGDRWPGRTLLKFLSRCPLFCLLRLHTRREENWKAECLTLASIHTILCRETTGRGQPSFAMQPANAPALKRGATAASCAQAGCKEGPYANY